MSRRGFFSELESHCETMKESDVAGRKTVVNARREVWTPTILVYRAKGKNGTGSDCVEDTACALAVAFAPLALREGIVEAERRAGERWCRNGGRETLRVPPCHMQ